MWRMTWPALVAGLAMGVGSSARAQNPVSSALLIEKSVQQELKLSAEQVEKVVALADAQREATREKFQALQDLSQAERRDKMQALTREMNEEANSKLGDILSKEQQARYKQINLQVRGIAAFTDRDIQARLKLTDDQTGKFREILGELQAQTREIFQNAGGDREASRLKLIELRREVMGKAQEILTAEQKQTWKELTGAPFEWPPRRP